MPVKKAPAKKAAKSIIPASLAACADKLYVVREARLDHDHQSTALKKDEGLLRDYLIAKMKKGETSGVQGQVAFAYIDSGTAFSVTDWGKVYAEIVRLYNKAKTPGQKLAAFRFLNKAVSKEPLEEMWDAGDTFPGIQRINPKKVMLSKRKGRK